MIQLYRVNAMLTRFLLQAKRDIHRFVDLFYWPTQDILVWGFTGYWLQKGQSAQVSLMLLIGLVLWTFMVQVNKEIGWTLVEEFWSDNFVNLMASPLEIGEWMLATMILGVIKAMVVLFYCSFVVWLVYGLNIFSVGLGIIPALGILIIFGWAIGFFTTSITIYYGQKLQVLTWIIGWLFTPFCGVFYPVEVLPPWIQRISYMLPPTYIFSYLRHLVAQQPAPISYLWVGFGLSIAYVLATSTLFKFSFSRSKVLGLARLERYE